MAVDGHRVRWSGAWREIIREEGLLLCEVAVGTRMRCPVREERELADRRGLGLPTPVPAVATDEEEQKQPDRGGTEHTSDDTAGNRPCGGSLARVIGIR